MANTFIRQLTHDDQQFSREWSNIFSRLSDFFIACEEESTDIPTDKVKMLDALVDYVLVDAKNSSNPNSTKCIFVERVALLCATDPEPPLVDWVRIFRRILDQPKIFDRWHLASLKAIFHESHLGEKLCEQRSSNLIDSILKSFEKHAFVDDQADKETISAWEDFLGFQLFSSSTCDTNRLNGEEIIEFMRSAYQRFFRFAARMSPRSSVWTGVLNALQRGLPTLFDHYENDNDSAGALNDCAENGSLPPPYLELLSKSYEKDPNLMKKNFTKVLTILEKLCLAQRFNDAYHFYHHAMDPHFDAGIDVEALLKFLIRLCPQVKIEGRTHFCHWLIEPISSQVESVRCKKSLAPLFFDFALAMLDLHVIEAPCCSHRLLAKNEFYPWKELAPKCTHLLQSCVRYDMTEKAVVWTESCDVDNILDLLVQRAQVHKPILQAVHLEAFAAIIRWLTPPPNSSRKRWSTHVYRMAKTTVGLLDLRQMTADACAQLIDALSQGISDHDADVETDESQYLSGWMGNFYHILAAKIGSSLETLKPIPSNIHRQIAACVMAALACPLHSENGSKSVEQKTWRELWRVISQCVMNENDARLYQSCLKQITSLLEEDEASDLCQWYTEFWNGVGNHCPTIAATHLEEFLRFTIDRHDSSLFRLLCSLYDKGSQFYHARLNDFIVGIFDSDASYATTMSQLFLLVCRGHPEILQATQVDQCFALLKTKPNVPHVLTFIYEGLSAVAVVQPHLFDAHLSQLMTFVTEHQDLSAFTCLKQYFVASTILHGSANAKEYLTLLIQLLQNRRKSKNELRSHIFHTCELIGILHPEVLEAKRPNLLAFQSEAECRLLIQLMDGKKMNVQQQQAIDRSREEILYMRQRVLKTEDNVQQVTTTVREQSKEVANLGERMKEVDQQVKTVDEKVQRQARDIERIDAKTLSHVPAEWGGEVSKLLNRRADNDWRLLGKRFGYSTSELRHLALHADPTMSLLNEWFMTHKADEATYGLVKTLDDIGRKDVSKIIRQAVAATGGLIPDDIPFEIKRLPPIFLSYQWGSQKAVLTLKHHLEAAGYACWMDIGQMGGGDKLFAKIDAGIRGAKVIICCINSAYAQSDNCLREVHLAVNTGKPLIPLQMEKQKWPPEGALGPIMSEYLYIRFYDRKANAQDYWPADRFPELLGQIRYHVAPNLDMITDQYKKWFEPRADRLIFLQPKTAEEKEQQTALKNPTAPLEVKHPHIMISYQWDRQKDVVALYTRLTDLGYRCWLDIFQMGGGDSLFEKIDDGIRHTQCVLACVTPNYIKSINCRREMSLADALKKPIVPLYLEETTTWPPTRPSSTFVITLRLMSSGHQKNSINSKID